MDMTRQEKIRILEEHLKILNVDKGIEFEKEIEALKYAINSLKTDESYQLMYEGGEIFTKADMVAMLTEIQLEIEELPSNRMAITDSSGLICYGYSEHGPTAKDASKVIQQKISNLKGDAE